MKLYKRDDIYGKTTNNLIEIARQFKNHSFSLHMEDDGGNCDDPCFIFGTMEDALNASLGYEPSAIRILEFDLTEDQAKEFILKKFARFTTASIKYFVLDVSNNIIEIL